MNECTNLEIRDLLPDLARGALSGASRLVVEDHVTTCSACRAELALVHKAHAALSASPPVDTARIVAVVTRSTAVRRDATAAVAQMRRRHTSILSTPARRVWLAAASVVAIVGAAVVASDRDRTPGSTDLPPVVVHVSEPTSPAPIGAGQTQSTTGQPASRAELVMGGGVSDLADADLESLLDVLDDVDTQLDVEPAVLVPVLEGDV